MNAELLLSLAGYSFLLFAGMLWIVLDSETAFIFDVFGKNFDYMWRHSGQRWKFTFMYGWRLLAVVSLIAACAYLAWQVATATSNWQAGSILVFAMLVLISLCVLPWIRIANGMRFQRALRSAAERLTPVAECVAVSPDISAVLDEAQYHTDSGWSAWHPKSVDDWPVVAPVAYVHVPPRSAVVFPVDFETFLAWRLGDQLPSAGSTLPFWGPGETTFVLRDVSPLRGVPDWSIVHAEMQVDDNCMALVGG